MEQGHSETTKQAHSLGRKVYGGIKTARLSLRDRENSRRWGKPSQFWGHQNIPGPRVVTLIFYRFAWVNRELGLAVPLSDTVAGWWWQRDGFSWQRETCLTRFLRNAVEVVTFLFTQPEFNLSLNPDCHLGHCQQHCHWGATLNLILDTCVTLLGAIWPLNAQSLGELGKDLFLSSWLQEAANPSLESCTRNTVPACVPLPAVGTAIALTCYSPPPGIQENFLENSSNNPLHPIKCRANVQPGGVRHLNQGKGSVL